MCFSYVRSCVRHFTHSEFPISVCRCVAIDYLLGSKKKILVFPFLDPARPPNDNLSICAVSSPDSSFCSDLEMSIISPYYSAGCISTGAISVAFVVALVVFAVAFVVGTVMEAPP